MKASDPPRLASWLLKHFGPGLSLEALTGDLHEGFSQGKSAAWYWRQVLAAIAWRKHLRSLLIWAGFSCLVTWLDLYGRPPAVSRPLDIAIFAVLLCTTSYLPGMLRAKQRLMLVVLITMFFLWFFRSYPELAKHYLILGTVSVSSLVLYRKPVPSPRQITMRKLTERQRLIASLHLALLRETNPELRLAYAEAISSLKVNHPLPGVQST